MGLMENGTTWLQRCLYVVTVAVLSSPTLHCLLYTFCGYRIVTVSSCCFMPFLVCPSTSKFR